MMSKGVRKSTDSCDIAWGGFQLKTERAVFGYGIFITDCAFMIFLNLDSTCIFDCDSFLGVWNLRVLYVLQWNWESLVNACLQNQTVLGYKKWPPMRKWQVT